MALQEELRAVYRSRLDDTATPSEEVWRRLDRLRNLLTTDVFLYSDRPQLVIITKSKKVPVLLEEKTIIGSSAGADIVLSCHFVSHQHCSIEQHDNHLKILDLGSTNGTFVNGERVGEMLLCDGDIIQLGTVTMVCLTRAPMSSDSP